MSSLFANKLSSVARSEFQTFGKLKEDQSPLAERVGEYWKALDRPDLDGRDRTVPWSAAFISHMVRLAGAGPAFPYNAQHSMYFYRTINDKLSNRKTGFWGFPIDEITVEPGDILGMNRENGPEVSYEWAEHHKDYKSHADIVVSVSRNQVTTLGGNVSNSVGEKIFKLKGGAWVNAKNDKQKVFVVIRSFLP